MFRSTTHDLAMKMESNQTADNSSLISLIEISENEAENGNANNNQLIGIDEIEEEEKSCNEVKLKNMSRAIRNWRKCLGCEEKNNLHRPSKTMRLFFCKSKKIYIQENDRVCNYHSQCQNWNQIHFKTASNFSGKVVDEMVKFLLNPPVNETEHSTVDIGLTDTEFKHVICELGLPENPKFKKEL